jgi:hypothetical protein
MNNSSGVTYIKDHKEIEIKPQLKSELFKIRDHAIAALMVQLQDMFDGIDDSFFELANNARSNNEQNVFFEAMREVRIQRKGMESQFNRELTLLFNTPPSLDKNRVNTPDTEINADTLTLVQNDSLEEDVAINTMAKKASANFQGQLLQFQTRISTFYTHTDRTSPVNPLDPGLICQAFISASTNLSVELKEKLIVFKQFDRYVMSNLGSILDKCNHYLIKLGILPDYKLSGLRNKANPPGSSSHTNAPRHDSTRSSIDPQPGQTETFTQLQTLIETIRNNPGSHFHRAPVSSNVHFVGDSDLLEMLSQLQQGSHSESIDLGSDEIQTTSVIDIRAALQEILNNSKSEKGATRALNQLDEDLINLVALLFEFILDDYNLSAPIQVLLSRLQIPILKVVIKDRSFFSSNAHPARQLLNSLAKAGIGWSDSSEKQKDQLYEKIHGIVHRILNEFDGDTGIFTQLNEEFSLFIAKEERRTSIVEQRTREAEEGRIKSQQAQKTVEDLLNKYINSATVEIPEIALTVLQNGWSRVMFLSYLKDDKEHQWQKSCGVAEDLVWCLQPHTDQQSRTRWIRIVPKLLRDIRDGLQGVSYGSSHLEDILSELKQAVTEAFRQQSKETRLKPKEFTKPTAKKQETEAIEQTAVQKQRELEDAAIEEFITKVDALTIGSWVEFELVNGSKFRCKLSTLVEEADCYIFVNRMGLKVVEKSKRELAQDIRKGRIKILEQGALLDRAMSAVVSNLKKMSGA